MGNENLTLIFRCNESELLKYVGRHLEHFRTKAFQRAGRNLSALQSNDLDRLGREGVEEIAVAQNLPLIDVSVRIPPF